MSDQPLVTVVTPTTCDPSVLRAVQSVADQSYSAIQHLVVIDNPDASVEIKAAIRQYNVDVIELPYATGKDRFRGHRIFGASTFLGKGDFFCFLDEDNWFDTHHVASLFDVIRSGFTWAFSFRKIVDSEGDFICSDDCESLGKWPSVLGEDDYLIDTSCYFLPRMVAVNSSHVWFRRFREPNMLEADRALVQFLRRHNPSYESSYCYSVNYRVGNTPQSVQKEFFLAGNQRMLEKFQGHVPWKKLESRTPDMVAIDWMRQIHAENPYDGFPADKFAMDLQGWGQDSPIFEHVVSTYCPSRMIEVGTWKGASAIKTAELMKRYHIPEPQLICVDTWLGSLEHWLNRDDASYFASLALKWGRPDLYNTFLANVVRAGHDDVIVPFPADTGTAAKFFLRKGMEADAIYLDASHEYENVMTDLVAYWKVLRPGGVFIGDDFNSLWPGVVRAVYEFAERLGLQVNTSFPSKFLIEKNN